MGHAASVIGVDVIYPDGRMAVSWMRSALITPCASPDMYPPRACVNPRVAGGRARDLPALRAPISACSGRPRHSGGWAGGWEEEEGTLQTDLRQPRPSFFMTDGTSDPFGILSIALQLVQGATEGPPGGPGLVFPAGDLLGLINDDACGLGRRFPRPGVGG